MPYFLILALLSTLGWSTTFYPVSMDDQLREAHGIVLGHYLKRKTVVLDNGKVATQMIIKLNKEWGMQSDLFGLDEIIVHYPGGTVNGITTEVHGVPKFVMGEKVAIFTKSIDNRYWGLNLGLGSYKVINYGNETMLINSLFPHDGKVGQIKLSDFEQKVKAIKGSNLKVVTTPSHDISGEEEITRAPASLDHGKNRSLASENNERDNQGEQPSFGIYWLLLILAFSFVLARMLLPKKSE